MAFSQLDNTDSRYDAVMVGAGIMSATLASLLHKLDPTLRLLIVERLGGPGLESSSALNNAGTGHAANCELNYTPLRADGSVEVAKAISINFAYERSLEFWASLSKENNLDPSKFLHRVPHISFVSGEKDVAFLRKRFDQLISLEAFSKMQWSHDWDEIREWIPLVVDGRRKTQPIAATRVERGTDVDFGALTSSFLEILQANGSVDLSFGTQVSNLYRRENSLWELELRCDEGGRYVQSPFVFLGAGGGALPLLQKSGISEAEDYAGFPVSGKWLVCSDQDLCRKHFAKVYGRARLGAPPMSMPHLDSRWIRGGRLLLFGPYAGYTNKFLKQGSNLDLIRSLRINNIGPTLKAGFQNLDLVSYLVSQVLQTDEDRLGLLREFFPNAISKDWRLEVAGQRVQIIKRTSKGGVLQMGTEVVSANDGSLAALLGASPGASTAVTIMLEVLRRCWPEQMESVSWQKKLVELLPSYGQDPLLDSGCIKSMRSRSDHLLGIFD
ncbi:malate:quinone oxidoreductase [Prochlorococcus sp. MIT 1341]|uniref:malate:quinone oxidoreductase n=1 Tax=Prochlorococcus sp. MIT 1341 TaxID=3096221 RepID=UPI002A75B18D|nr:malate:quinone oxidoreductase [Prochlorococcus sp. MIT 1341]